MKFTQVSHDPNDLFLYLLDGPLSRVADLIYNIDGVCDGPQYVWPTTGADVAAKFRGTREELRELASLPELADFEWGEEAKKMLVAWEAAERNKACAIL